MNKTLFDACNTEEQKHEFDRLWTSANRDNLYVTIKPCSDSDCIVTAFDKETDREMAFFRVRNDEAYSFEYLQKDFEPREFDIKLVCKPGDKVFFVLPDYGEDGSFNLKLHKEKIREGIVRSIQGSSTTQTIVGVCTCDNGIDNQTYLLSQCFYFVDRQSAEEACDLTPADGWNSWESYENDVKDIIEYKYYVKSPIKYGEIYRNDRKAIRILFESDVDSNTNELTVQLSPIIKNIEGTHEYSNIKDEVRIMQSNRRTVPVPYMMYNDEEIFLVVDIVKFCLRLKELESQYIRVKKHSIYKMRKAIEERRNDILEQLASIDDTCDNNEAYNIKMLEVQCSAELRLLYNLEKYSLNEKEFIIC